MLKRLIESHLENMEYEHSVISLTETGSVGAELKSQGIDVKSLGMRSPWSLLTVLWKLIKNIRGSKPDIVQTWMYHADLLGGIAARFAGIRNIIWGIRTTKISSGNSVSTLFVRRLCAILSHWVPLVIVCAAEASRKVHVTLGYDSNRMAVVPNGFDLTWLQATTKERQQLREQCGFTTDALVVGSLGRFNSDKDQQNFVQAAALLASNYLNVNFLMVGRDLNGENSQLAHWIEETGYSDRFVLLGERSDVPVCLSAMDIFCLHSQTEGFPNVLGEAMSMALPCVTTDVGDASLLLGNTGVIVPKKDSAVLALGIAKLIKLIPEERALIGRQAQQRIIDYFTISRTKEQFEMVYSQVISRGKR